jgi:cytochrome c peroxidase
MFPRSRNAAASLATACRVLLFVGTVTAMFQGVLACTIADEKKAQPASSQVMAPLPRTVPTPHENPTTLDKVSLGKLLFFDPRLSGDNKTSCATCHRPEKAFADGIPRGKGTAGKTLNRNTPSLLNIGYSSTLFWDGRVKSLEQQALLPIQAADEMNQDLGELEQELSAVPAYAQQFQAVFQSKVTREGIAQALSAFERTLTTDPSPYDRYLAGEAEALSPEAKRGLELFFGQAGCARCHHGPLLTDEKFYRLGFSGDQGLGSVTGKTADNYKFRTPSLRNVARTAPYMHDGSFRTLDEVLFYYLRSVPSLGPDGLALDIESLQGVSIDETADLIAFLEALSGDAPRVSAPALP